MSFVMCTALKRAYRVNHTALSLTKVPTAYVECTMPMPKTAVCVEPTLIPTCKGAYHMENTPLSACKCTYHVEHTMMSAYKIAFLCEACDIVCLHGYLSCGAYNVACAEDTLYWKNVVDELRGPRCRIKLMRVNVK